MDAATKRNEGGRYSSKGASDWYRDIETANIARVEADDAERALVTALAIQVGNAVEALPEAATRIAKAATLVQHKAVWPLQHNAFLVESQHAGADEAYLVHRRPAWTCTCADYAHRGGPCKHILAVQMTVKLGTTYQPSYN